MGIWGNYPPHCGPQPLLWLAGPIIPHRRMRLRKQQEYWPARHRTATRGTGCWFQGPQNATDDSNPVGPWEVVSVRFQMVTFEINWGQLIF